MSALIAVVVTLMTYAVIYSMKPRLRFGEVKLDSTSIDKPTLHMIVINGGRCQAVNLRIEVCACDIDHGYTYHFKLDHPDFLILPGRRSKDNKKVFKTFELAESATRYYTYEQIIAKLQKGEFQLRVRIHSYHEFSGLGKAKERIYNKL